MPNTGMLDHVAYKPQGRKRTYTHWMGAWPSSAGYQTVRSLKVSNFSRHLVNQARKEQQLRMSASRSRPASAISQVAIGNSISPFHTSMKPTCGWFFSRETCHRKAKIGIPPSNLVAWRSSQVGHSTLRTTRARTA